MTTEWFGPIRPYLIDTWPLVRLIRRPWTKCGLTRPGPAFVEVDGFDLDPRKTADAGADRHSGANAGVLVHVGEARVLERLARGVDRIDDERVDLALDLGIHAFVGIEAVFMVLGLYLARDLGLLVADVEARDRADPALSREEIFPGRLDVGAQRRHQPETRHHDTAHFLHSV